ncbi:MAG: hypothetical protein AAGD47_15225 [Pseudomonadota bacterium]
MVIAALIALTATLGAISRQAWQALVAGFAVGFGATLLPGASSGPLARALSLSPGDTQGILWSHMGLGLGCAFVGFGLRRMFRP